VTDAETRPGCLSPETLAAFIDGRLDVAARAAAETHLAECEDCYEAMVETTRTLHDVSGLVTTSPASPAARPGPRTGWWIAGLTAAAAVILIVMRPLFWPSSPDGAVRPELAPLVAAARDLRPVEGRLTGGFRWAAAPAVRRAVEASPPLEVEAAATRLKQTAEQQKSAATLAASGTARLALRDLDGAIRDLEAAIALDGKQAAFFSDLSAALLARSRQPGHEADANRALAMADAALVLDPRLIEALFNQALALEALGSTAQAVKSWTQYLQVEPSREWRNEATGRLNALRPKG
jgi:cytochrome c-type biogenesis protein CcmH/NrfG